METKKFNHKEIEICRLSKKPINTTKERYAIVLECDGKEIYSVGFYRGEMLVDLIKGKGELIKKELVEKHQRMAGGMLQQLKPFMQHITN